MAHGERPNRVRSFLFALLARPALFAAWSFVLWGTLVAALVVLKALTSGPREALLAVAGTGDSFLAWANAASAVIAAAVWLAFVALRFFPRERAAPPPDDEADD